MEKAITYTEYVNQKGKMKEIGAKAYLTDKALKKYRKKEEDLVKLIINQISQCVAKGFIRKGLNPFSVINEEGWIEKDLSLRATEFGVLMDALSGTTPIQYLSMAYEAWQDTQNTIEDWEKKSLSEYLLHWLYREEKDKKVYDGIYKLLDKLEPEWRGD